MASQDPGNARRLREVLRHVTGWDAGTVEVVVIAWGVALVLDVLGIISIMKTQGSARP